MSATLESLQAARAAAGRNAWRETYEAYGAVDRAQLTAPDLERYADAAWWSGKLDEAIALRETAYGLHSKAGDTMPAARLALILTRDHSGRGAFAVAHGWFATAERLLANEPESAASAYLLLTRAVEELFSGELASAVEKFGAAHELGRKFGDRDTEIIALSGRGRALVKMGEVEQGLALLDEASAAAASGDLDPYTTGLVYCMTISSCQDVGDYRRAAEWTETANKWCDRLDVSGFPGACRIHRAEAMRLRGDLVGAERQALEACEELHDFERMITAGGYYEIGEVRRLLGDFAAAEAAYRTADELGRTPQPGLALLRLAQGKLEAAAAAITRTLEETEDPFSRVRRLPAQVEISVARGDLRTARAALEELEQIVDAYKIGGRRAPAFDAAVHVASGRIRLAEGDAEGAERCLRHARREWQQVGAPYETAVARMLLGLAFRRQGDEHGATAELDAAHGVFERLGARLDAGRVEELLGRRGTRRTFVFTDIVDSTKLLETLGDTKWRKLLARHDELVRERIVEFGGEVIKHTGDGFFAAFDDPKGALDAAVAIQRALDAEIVAPDVRIGLHAGDAFRTESDYGGQGVHVAARIGAAARAAEILASSLTLEGVATGCRLSEPRAERLAGISEPVDVVAVDWR